MGGIKAVLPAAILTALAARPAMAQVPSLVDAVSYSATGFGSSALIWAAFYFLLSTVLKPIAPDSKGGRIVAAFALFIAFTGFGSMSWWTGDYPTGLPWETNQNGGFNEYVPGQGWR